MSPSGHMGFVTVSGCTRLKLEKRLNVLNQAHTNKKKIDLVLYINKLIEYCLHLLLRS